VLVRIRDNGRGLDRGHNSGLGLVGMRERVWALGGTLAIASDADGVTVEAIIPVTEPLPDAPALYDREIIPVLSGK
jgi:two-component system sensor histidine kinase UhpB